AWVKDGSGFFYGRFDGDSSRLEEVNRFQKLYFHRLGEDQSRDELVYERPDQGEWGFSPSVSEDGSTLLITVWKGTDPKNLLFWKDLRDRDAPVRELVSDFTAKFAHVGDLGRTFWLLTDADAPRGRVLALDLDRPDPEDWKEVIPQAPETLEEVRAVGGRLVASYLRDARSVVRMFSPDGAPLGEIALPGLGTAGGFTGEIRDMESFYVFTGFT